MKIIRIAFQGYLIKYLNSESDWSLLAFHSDIILEFDDSFFEHGEMSLELILLSFDDSDQLYELVIFFFLLLEVFFAEWN